MLHMDARVGPKVGRVGPFSIMWGVGDGLGGPSGLSGIGGLRGLGGPGGLGDDCGGLGDVGSPKGGYSLAYIM